ncbi:MULTISPECIES: RNA polymerase sigma factor [unclassified Sphingobacterium]|uniref:RNA polymerase sigma factor n=1 Tax=unclassified Sphingobacterium TaxID=2609468 RepID=UPI001AE7C04C|nr:MULTISPECIES: RNA polymerase sigma factor [unclassified Sphingobacterium]MDR6737874.1 RNA polymerase sigma-70 factor (ECF subfamily) [Sphingobacterium sp. 2149]
MNNYNLNVLINEKRSLLNHFAAKFTADPDEKEDLIQETWIRALKSIDEFVQHPKLMSWLYVIMKHTYINKYRKAKRITEIQDQYVVLESTNTTEHNKGINKFMAEDIEKAMTSLTSENYEIFRLFLDGYKYHEIASYFDMPEGTVKTRIHMVRKKLQKQLKVYRMN